MSFFTDMKRFTEPNYVGNHKPYVPSQAPDAHIFSKSRRREYIDEIVNWLEEPLVRDGIPVYGKRRPICRKHIVLAYASDVINMIISKGMEIYDQEQLREDIIYYMYKLTHLK
jgi:hypothetical protein